jgi:hypothetical protein
VPGNSTAKGQVFNGNGSLVRDFTKRLKLVAELFGALRREMTPFERREVTIHE